MKELFGGKEMWVGKMQLIAQEVCLLEASSEGSPAERIRSTRTINPAVPSA